MPFNAMLRPWSWLPVALCFASPALADDKAAAEVLFDDGKKLLGDGQFDAACAKLAESHRLDPGVGTLLYLAECHERAGRTASAWVAWREAGDLAARTSQAPRAKIARERADKLVPRLIRVQIEVPPPSDLPSLTITRNGALISRPLWGSALPVDPGAIEIVASAPGRLPWKLAIQGSSPGTTIVRVPILDVEPATPVSPPPPPAVQSPSPSASPPSASPPSSPPAGAEGGSRRTLALVAGGLGLASVGVGSYFGLKTISTWNDARALCPSSPCGKEASDLSKQAATSGNLSTLFFVVGAVGLGTGVGLWLTAPQERSARLTPAVGPGLAGMLVQGAF